MLSSKNETYISYKTRPSYSSRNILYMMKDWGTNLDQQNKITSIQNDIHSFLPGSFKKNKTVNVRNLALFIVSFAGCT